jgi:hypothetical protein
VLAIGIVLSVMLSVAAGGTNSIFEALNSLVCCGAFTAVVFLDAAFYKGKADWQQAHGMPAGGSKTSMILELVIGGILAILFILTFISTIFLFI